MAGKQLIIQTKVQASTILEVVVSLVITTLVFGIAMMIYANVTRLSLSAKKIKAQALLKEMQLQAEQTNKPSNQSFNVGDFRIEQEVKPFGQDTILSEVDMTAYDLNQEKITELKKVILNR